LAATPLDAFELTDMEKNRRLGQKGKENDRTLMYRTKGEYWGKQLAVAVT